MSISPNVYFEIYWEGPCGHDNDWDISTVDIKIKKISSCISAKICSFSPLIQEQRLYFDVKKNSVFCFESFKTPYLECPMDVAKTIKISVRIFQDCRNTSEVRERLDRSNHFERRSWTDFPVIVNKLPVFKPNETYQVKIINENGSLRATIEKKLEEAVLKEAISVDLTPKEIEQIRRDACFSLENQSPSKKMRAILVQ